MSASDQLNFVDVVLGRNVAEGRARKAAIGCDQETLTYAELEERTNRAGNALASLGIGQGDRFMIRAPNSLDYVATLLGGMKIGAVAVPTNTLLRARELAMILKNSNAALVIVADTLREELDDTATDVKVVTAGEFARQMNDASAELESAKTGADDPAYAIYTSGSTGDPKGVEHAHRTVFAAGEPVVRDQLKLSDEDNMFVPVELSSLIGFDFGMMLPLLAGAQGSLSSGRFDPEGFVAAIERNRYTIVMSVPTMWRVLLSVPDIENKFDLSSIKYALCGGEPLPQDTYDAVKARMGFEIYEMIGSTEAHPYIANPVGKPPKVGSLGLPVPGRDATIRADDGRECEVDEVGNICLRSEDGALALGYRKRAEVWREMHRDGWFYTGDLGYRDSDGYFWFVSRADDVILSRSYRVSPGEVENATMDHPAVLESGVVGVPDEVIGERVRAYVVLNPNHEPGDALAEEIIESVRRTIAPYKAPKEIEFVPDLPKTMTGKVQRNVLRDRARADNPLPVAEGARNGS